MKGHLILLVGLPGGGKGTLRKHVRLQFPQLTQVVSCTTRPARPGEVQGVDYYFLSEDEFRTRIARGDFLEWIEQDGGKLYGTLKAEVLDRLAAGAIVFHELEVRGVHMLKELVSSDQMTTIFIDSDSWEILARRMKARAPISDEELEERHKRHERERHFVSEADVVVHNYDGKITDAKEEIEAAITRILEAHGRA